MRRVNQTRSILSLALALLMCLSAAAAAPGSEEKIPAEETLAFYPVEGGSLMFEKSSGTVVGCESGVTGAVIPSEIEGTAVLRIGNGAFAGCEQLTRVVIPDGVRTVAHRVFQDCTGLTQVDIGRDVIYIGDSVFSGCTALKEIQVDPDNGIYSSVDGVLFSEDGSDLLCCPAGKAESYGIPYGVKRIFNTAFENCTGLTQVFYPAGWTRIMVWDEATGLSCPLNVYDTSRLFPGEVTIQYSGAAQPAPVAFQSTQTVELDGARITLPAYADKDEEGYDTNYVRLRDLAMLLADTAARFQVEYDGGINITTGVAYTPNGSEGSVPFSGDRTYQKAFTETKVNGVVTDLDAILLTDDNWGGHTYYKLRDLGQVLGFQVDWTLERGIFLETGTSGQGE